ncbi:MetQ/NlpA family ABC transporter substrate-binding protein [Nocardiopsis sp. NPDC006938]|uniref:MetQ/NlpA family ABC transporter substrate-binding protein n=1 Tax=Nocardiopsis sp. NPDC006938 TaxID=3364337 RepID=UPI00368678B4
MRRATLAVPAALALFAVTACGAPSENASRPTEDAAGSQELSTLVVGATAVPAGDILAFVQEELAADAGLDLDVREFSDYIAPNAALAEGQLDVNLYQHEPFLLEYNEGNGTDLVAVEKIYLPPLGLYSNRVDAVDELEKGAEVALPNDPTNEFRALLLLQEGGLITLADDVDEATFSLSDIEDNPLDLRFREVEAAQLPRSLDDVDAAIVNNNYAQEAGLDFEEDSILLEEVEGNAYVNVLAARSDNADDPRVATLVELLNSPETVRFIEEEYQGSVIPAAA